MAFSINRNRLRLSNIFLEILPNQFSMKEQNEMERWSQSQYWFSFQRIGKWTYQLAAYRVLFKLLWKAMWYTAPWTPGLLPAQSPRSGFNVRHTCRTRLSFKTCKNSCVGIFIISLSLYGISNLSYLATYVMHIYIYIYIYTIGIENTSCPPIYLVGGHVLFYLVLFVSCCPVIPVFFCERDLYRALPSFPIACTYYIDVISVTFVNKICLNKWHLFKFYFSHYN